MVDWLIIQIYDWSINQMVDWLSLFVSLVTYNNVVRNVNMIVSKKID